MQLRWDTLLDWYLKYDREHGDQLRPESYKPVAWRASQFGYCARRMAMVRAGIPPTRSEMTLKRLRAYAWGTTIERFAKGVLWRLGVVIDQQVKLSTNDGTLVGTMDLLVGGPVRQVDEEPEDVLARWTPEYREFTRQMRKAFAEEWAELLEDPVGLEVKSAHSFAMKLIRQDGPYRFHVGQLAAYALAIRENPAQVKVRPHSYALLYIGRDSVGALQVPLPGGTIDHARHKLDQINAAWDARELPDCTCNRQERNWCDYATKDGCCGVDDWDRIRDELQASLDALATR